LSSKPNQLTAVTFTFVLFFSPSSFGFPASEEHGQMGVLSSAARDVAICRWYNSGIGGRTTVEFIKPYQSKRSKYDRNAGD